MLQKMDRPVDVCGAGWVDSTQSRRKLSGPAHVICSFSVCFFDISNNIKHENWGMTKFLLTELHWAGPQAAQAQDRVAKHDLCYQASCVTRLSIYRLCMGNSLSSLKCYNKVMNVEMNLT